MSTVNKVFIMGRLGKDPRVFQAGEKKICSFHVATSSGSGEKKNTQWHNVVTYSPHSDQCEKYLRKGSNVMVEGKISYKKYTDKSGNERLSTEIQASYVTFLDKKIDNEYNKETTTSEVSNDYESTSGDPEEFYIPF